MSRECARTIEKYYQPKIISMKTWDKTEEKPERRFFALQDTYMGKM
jgi:hypothetical protein